MFFQIYYSINILPFDATGHRYELLTVSVNEPYSLYLILVSNVYLVTAFQVRCSVVIVVVVVVVIIIIIIIIVVFVIIIIIIIINVVFLLLLLLLCCYYYQHHFLPFFLPCRL